MPFLFVDRIVDASPGEWVKGLKHVTSDDAYLVPDAQGRLCFSPSLIGETLGQLAAWNVMHYNDFSRRPVAGVVARVCLHRPAYLGETILLESFIDSLDDQMVAYHGLARVGSEVIFTLEDALGPLLPMNDFIDQEVIRQQFAEINRPGDWASISSQSTQGYPMQKPTTLPVPMSFDRILECEAGVSMLAEKRLTRSAAYFADHFPKKPVLPLTVLLECKMNLARDFLKQTDFAQAYAISAFQKIKMNDFVQPGDVLLCQLNVKQQSDEELVLSYRTEVNAKRVCVLDAVFRVQSKQK